MGPLCSRHDPNVYRALLSQEESLTAPICYFKESNLRDGTDKGPGFGPDGTGKRWRSFSLGFLFDLGVVHTSPCNNALGSPIPSLAHTVCTPLQMVNRATSELLGPQLAPDYTHSPL